MRKIELFFARDTMPTLYKVKRTTATPDAKPAGGARFRPVERSQTLFTL
jgi:hypothetical protein